ncbi:MAG: ABC transporter ATP-binding protein [Acidilobus sp.]
MRTERVLELREVTKRFGDVEALRSVSLSVSGGEFIGLVGPNGAGKTTLIRVSLGLLRPEAGSVRLMGADPFINPTAREKVGVIFERPNLPPSMPLVDILSRAARIYGASSDEVRRSIELTGLKGHELKPFGHLSAGLKQRAAIAHALIARPSLIMADEPTSNLDPVERQEVLNLLADLNREGTTILLSSHVLSEVLRAVRRVAVMKAGTIISVGPPDEIVAGMRVGRVRTPEPEALAKVLAERGLEAKVQAQAVYVRIKGDAEERELLLALADAVQKGLRYYGIDLVEPGLEEVLR